MIVDLAIGQVPVTGAVVLRPSARLFRLLSRVCLHKHRETLHNSWTGINLIPDWKYSSGPPRSSYLSRLKPTDVELLI